MILGGMLDGVLPFLTSPPTAVPARREANFSFFLMMLSAALVAWLIIRSRPPRWGVWALLGVTFLDMLLFGGTQNNAKVNPADYFRRPAEIVRYMRQAAGPEVFRVNTRNEDGMIMDRNQGMIDRLFMMEGYTPLALQRVYPPVTSPDRMLNLLNVKFQTVTNRERRSLSLVPRTGYLPRAFMVYDVRVMTGEQALIAEMNREEFDPAGTALLETDPGRTLPPVTGIPAWSAEIREYRNDRIGLAVRTDRDGMLVLSEMYYPGWTATVDGAETPVHRTDYNLRGLFVPAGTHTVEVRFTPAALARGLWITLGTLLLCAAGIVLPLTQRRSARAPEP